MDKSGFVQQATDLAMKYHVAINNGELDAAYDMILPAEKEAGNRDSFIASNLGVDSIIKNLKKYFPDVGKIETVSTAADNRDDSCTVTMKHMFPDANIVLGIVSEVMAEVFGLAFGSIENLDQEKFKKKIAKAIKKKKNIFKNGQLLEVEIVEKVVLSDGTMFIAPGWIEERRKALEKQANKAKLDELADSASRARFNGSIIEAQKAYEELKALDEEYALEFTQKYGDIEERVELAKNMAIEITDPNPDSDSMVQVKITNNNQKGISEVNVLCEVYDGKKEMIFSDISQMDVREMGVYTPLAPGAVHESWVTFNSDAGSLRKEVRVAVVNANYPDSGYAAF